MKMKYFHSKIFVIIFLKVSLILCMDNQENDLKLELVQVIFRHGDRTPTVSEYSFLNYLNTTVFEPFGLGQLTNEGKRREFKLGQMLREKYDSFLGDTYRPDDVYSYSSYNGRTKESLQLVLAALFPPSNSLKWNENLNWIPISINSLPGPLDVNIHPYKCQEYEEEHRKIRNSEAFKNIMQKYKISLTVLENYYKMKIDLVNLHRIRDNLKILGELKLPFPEWYTTEIHNNIYNASRDLFLIQAYTTKLVKYTVGSLINKFIQNMQESNINSKKIYLFSGHDRNIYTFAKAHQFEIPGELPKYGCAFILEKYRGLDNQIYIRLLYWTGVTEELIPVNINNCPNQICPLTKYVEFIDPILMKNDELRCLYNNLTPENVENILKISDD